MMKWGTPEFPLCRATLFSARTRRAFIPPATHRASDDEDPSLPPI